MYKMYFVNLEHLCCMPNFSHGLLHILFHILCKVLTSFPETNLLKYILYLKYYSLVLMIQIHTFPFSGALLKKNELELYILDYWNPTPEICKAISEATTMGKGIFSSKFHINLHTLFKSNHTSEHILFCRQHFPLS